MSLYFRKQKLLFVHIPKNAGSSFKKWAYANLEKGSFSKYKTHADLKQCQQHFPEAEMSFCFVRNPYERVVSMFHFVGQRAQDRLKGIISKSRISPEHDREIIEYYNLGIDNYVYDLYHNVPTPYTVGWRLSIRKRLQNTYVDNNTIIIKTENIVEEFKQIQDMLHCHIPLFSSNTSSHEGRKTLSAESKKLIQQMYTSDFIKYGYDFEV